MPQGLTAQPRGHVAVVGGGVIGLAIARHLAPSGWKVTLLERDKPGRAASHAAAGMLAPQLEFHSDPDLLSVGKLARNLYADYVEELQTETGLDVDLRLRGIVEPESIDATASGETAERPVPEGAERLSGSRLRALEPGISPAVQTALYFSEDGSVDNRRLVEALLVSCRKRGVTIVAERTVDEVLLQADRVCGVRLGEEHIQADIVINCCGAWASQLEVRGSDVPVRPIKGQMLRLQPATSPADGPRRTIFGTVYLVPRSDGNLIVGTTVEDKGFDTSVDAGAVHRLLEAALHLYPGLARARFVDSWAGLRPRARSELPIVGQSGPRGHYVANGHYRNGILFAPLTALAVADQLEQRQTSESECFLRPEAPQARL